MLKTLFSLATRRNYLVDGFLSLGYVRSLKVDLHDSVHVGGKENAHRSVPEARSA
jgi:hypothetical protein